MVLKKKSILPPMLSIWFVSGAAAQEKPLVVGSEADFNGFNALTLKVTPVTVFGLVDATPDAA